MKRLFTTRAVALAFTAGAWAENGYRANYWCPGTFEPGTRKPFVWHSLCEANSEAEVRAYIYGECPNAVIESIEYLGVWEQEPPGAAIPYSPYNNAMDPPATEEPAPEMGPGH